MVTLFVLYLNSKAGIEVFVIDVMGIIQFLTESSFRMIRGYIIPSSIDLQIELQSVPFSDLSKMAPGETSEKIRERVVRARQIQEARYRDFKGIHCNAQMTERMLHQFAEPDAASMEMIRRAMERLKLSARAYNRILKVARTIADLDNAESVQSRHIAEAIGYRNLDRSDWAEMGIS